MYRSRIRRTRESGSLSVSEYGESQVKDGGQLEDHSDCHFCREGRAWVGVSTLEREIKNPIKSCCSDERGFNPNKLVLTGVYTPSTLYQVKLEVVKVRQESLHSTPVQERRRSEVTRGHQLTNLCK